MLKGKVDTNDALEENLPRNGVVVLCLTGIGYVILVRFWPVDVLATNWFRGNKNRDCGAICANVMEMFVFLLFVA